jgi:hypothetical protein
MFYYISQLNGMIDSTDRQSDQHIRSQSKQYCQKEEITPFSSSQMNIHILPEEINESITGFAFHLK